jgi:hypothetical protein
MKIKSDTKIVSTSNQNNQMQDIKRFKTNINSLKLNHRKLR